MLEHTQELMQKGDNWNESEESRDPITLRPIRRYTKRGLFNTTPTYHTNISFTADADYFVFVRGSVDGRNALFKASTLDGRITQLTDPVDGLGHWGSIQGKDMGRYANGRGISAGTLCLAPHSRWLAFNQGRSLRMVHLDSLEERCLIEDTGIEWATGVMSFDALEEEIIFPAQPAHPELINGHNRQTAYRDALGDTIQTNMHAVSLQDASCKIIHQEAARGCAHVAHCPIDKNYILFDRDNAGEYNRLESRCYVLHAPSNSLTEIRPRNKHRFQTHAAWTWDGQHIIYHGRAYGGGWFIGISTRAGEILNEWHFPQDHYGHVAAAPDRPAIILDGNLSDNMLLWLYYDGNEPRIEIIARHDTEWKGCPGQIPHPHAQCDRSGRFVLFNACRDARSDVYTVRV